MSQKFNQQPLEHTHSGDILSHDSYQHQNLTPYSNEVPKRKDFVVSFITGAIIGSTIGLLYKNKGFEKIDELKKKEQELEQKYLNIKEQAETNFNAIKSKIEDFKQQDSISPDEIAAQQQAIKHETNDTLKAPSNKTKKMIANNQAQRLAQAAKGKAQKMEQDSSVTAKTKALLTEPELKFVKVERVPNLVTKPSINQPEAQIKDQQTHQSAHFDNGVITHEEKSIQQDNSTKNERKSTPKQAQRVEKAKSKIDKRTFND
ncbi:YtxH domain-containing protein [Staphylococcus lugdunensis]|uniref:YtxH domain-containing protein n=1 Tax=Staphylococcus lugdunensis TaxID=28035 RepID=UPI001F4C89FE|nr:YtxH domain-containing protein [Staphylococcus lugdunensis]MCH8645555.1 YtxH domain-containing protein [Staphylococcus lugdunensis]